MKKMIINNQDKYKYELKDKDNKIYHFNIEFYNLKQEPKIGDYIYINENLLQEEYSVLSFDFLDSKYGRSIDLLDSKDIIVLLINNEKLYLKRVYG